MRMLLAATALTLAALPALAGEPQCLSADELAHEIDVLTRLIEADNAKAETRSEQMVLQSINYACNSLQHTVYISLAHITPDAQYEEHVMLAIDIGEGRTVSEPRILSVNRFPVRRW